jgi:hypothetical protein
MKRSLENQGPAFTPVQLVNHDFLRGLEGSRVITANDPEWITRNPNQKG